MFGREFACFHAFFKPVGVFLAPHVQHVHAPGDKLTRQRHELPVVLRLEAVAVVLLSVQRLARIRGELIGRVYIIGEVRILREVEAAGEFILKLLLMVLRYAVHPEGIAPFRRKGAQRLHRGAQRPRADGENKAGMPLIAQLRQHPALKRTDELAEVLVPDVDVAEVIIGAGAVFTKYYLVHPRLVGEGDGLEFQHDTSVRLSNKRLCRFFEKDPPRQ